MFENALSFNQSLNDWNVSNVKFVDKMFKNARKYTQPMSKWRLRSLASYCETDDFLKNCIMWVRFNDEDDMPLKDGKRLEIPEELKKIWK